VHASTIAPASGYLPRHAIQQGADGQIPEAVTTSEMRYTLHNFPKQRYTIMKTTLLPIAITSLLLAAPVLHAQESDAQSPRATPAAPAIPAAPASPAQRAMPAPAGQAAANPQLEKDFVVLENNMKSLQAQSTRIADTSDDAERQELVEAHFASMQANMKSMQAFMTSMNGAHAPAATPGAR